VGSSPASPVLQKPSGRKAFQGNRGRKSRFREALALGKKLGKSARIDHD
jgi:hypothetical protein